MQELLQLIPEVKTIKTALNGEEALDVIQANAKTQFDIIFLDIHMPIMDGPATVKELRERHERGLLNLSKTKILALSAITADQFRLQESSPMFDSFMEKPINF
jgi:CheY-like chemotaxis protein